MKNIITIALIFIVPIFAYLFLSKNFNDNIVIANDSNMPTLLTFSSAMCLDCQKLKNVLTEIEGDYNKKVNFVSVDAGSNSKKTKEQIKKHKVVLVPTMVFLDVNGVEKKKIEGFIPKEQLIVEVEELING